MKCSMSADASEAAQTERGSGSDAETFTEKIDALPQSTPSSADSTVAVRAKCECGGHCEKRFPQSPENIGLAAMGDAREITRRPFCLSRFLSDRLAKELLTREPQE